MQGVKDPLAQSHIPESKGSFSTFPSSQLIATPSNSNFVISHQLMVI